LGASGPKERIVQAAAIVQGDIAVPRRAGFRLVLHFGVVHGLKEREREAVSRE